MQIEIDFRPIDGGPQTLYADLPEKEVERIEAAATGPEAADTILYIPSRTEKNGPVHEWMFRASRITVRRV